MPTGNLALNGRDRRARNHDHGNWQEGVSRRNLQIIDALKRRNQEWVQPVQHRGRGTHTGPG
jgi:hypothetical protein